MLVKTFHLPLVRGVPTSAVKVETRVLLRTDTGWEGYVYRWRDDQSDADLLPGAATRAYTITDPAAPGGSVAQTWTFPSRSDCARCHTAAAGQVLGLRTRQLNRTFPYASGEQNQLDALYGAGYLDAYPGDPATLPAHPDLADEGVAVAERARAYLDVNCAVCHRPAGGSGTLDGPARDHRARRHGRRRGRCRSAAPWGCRTDSSSGAGVPEESLLWQPDAAARREPDAAARVHGGGRGRGGPGRPMDPLAPALDAREPTRGPKGPGGAEARRGGRGGVRPSPGMP